MRNTWVLRVPEAPNVGRPCKKFGSYHLSGKPQSSVMPRALSPDPQSHEEEHLGPGVRPGVGMGTGPKAMQG